jgi:hypothetical protein
MLEQVFSIANSAALFSWIALIFLPRWMALLATLRWGVVGLLSALYAVLVSVFFFRVEGGGYFSLEAVETLFTSSEVVLAGWVHYLAFDLFVGIWIAARSDELRLSRLIQAPILLATFMFGPVGYLFFLAVQASAQATRPKEVLA